MQNLPAQQDQLTGLARKPQATRTKLAALWSPNRQGRPRGEWGRTGHSLVDITGKRFGDWTVLAIRPERKRRGRRVVAVLWLCRCDCGTERIVWGTNLRLGRSASCGCRVAKRNTKHGHARKGKVTSAYKCWVRMLQRCFNPNGTHYPNYGARGIKPCERWLKFENFYADMGDPPPGLSIDRINVNGDYEPGNCRWTTPAEQARNRRPFKPRRRRTSLAELQAYAAALARAASAPGSARTAP